MSILTFLWSYLLQKLAKKWAKKSIMKLLYHEKNIVHTIYLLGMEYVPYDSIEYLEQLETIFVPENSAHCWCHVGFLSWAQGAFSYHYDAYLVNHHLFCWSPPGDLVIDYRLICIYRLVFVQNCFLIACIVFWKINLGVTVKLKSELIFIKC